VRVATANVKVTLSPTLAGECLDEVLATAPQIVGLQEWSEARRSTLRKRGRVVRLPRLARLARRGTPTEGYVFGYPLTGGQPVGVDAAWGEILTLRAVELASRAPGIRATLGTEALIRERETGRTFPVLSTHLMAHHDRPANRDAWQEGRTKARKWAQAWLEQGYSPFVLGDMNKHLMDLPPLVSCWDGNPRKATFGARTIDVIFGAAAAASVKTIQTASDHKAVVAEYDD
jgi:hypothetical protein